LLCELNYKSTFGQILNKKSLQDVEPLTGGPNDPPSAWHEIIPVSSQVTMIEGNLRRNTLDVWITPNARKPSAANHSEAYSFGP